MNPDVNKIFNKLKEDKMPSTQLASQQTKLSIQADVNKVVDELGLTFDILGKADIRLDDASDEVRQAKKKFDKIVNDIEADAKSARADISQGESIKSKVEAMAKDLGVDPGQVDGYDLLDVSIRDLKEAIKGIPSIIKSFSKF
jgi:hypothetical protein